MVDVLVREGSVHGQPMARYGEILQSRLPEYEVVVPQTREEERALIAQATVVTGGRLAESLLSEATALEYFACTAAGTDSLPLDELSAAGVAVTNASGVHGPNVAEHVIGAILAFERGFFAARHRQDRREWRSMPVGELAGSTVAVVGLGAIGEAIVARLDPFDVHTVGVRYSPSKESSTDEVYGFEDIERAVADADVVVLACPLTDETRGLVGADVLHTMPTEALVVNVARGPVVETDALVSALQRNAIGGAALDVTDPEPLPSDHDLWGFENVLITPHVAGNTPKYFERLADVVAPNVRTVIEGGDLGTLENRVV